MTDDLEKQAFKKKGRTIKVVAILASLLGMLLSSTTEGIVQGIVESGIKDVLMQNDLPSTDLSDDSA